MKTLILCLLITALIVFIGMVALIGIFGPPHQPCVFGPCILK